MKEKQNLLSDINHLKAELDEALNKLKMEVEKNRELNNELCKFKQEEMPHLKDKYETVINKIKRK